MTVLEDYDKRCRRDPLTPDSVLDHVIAAERHLERSDITYRVEQERVMCWLSDRLQAVYAALENPGVPAASRCAWCFRAGPQTDEAWSALPKMTFDDAGIHAQVCEHNPLVQEVRRLTAELEHVRGIVFDADLRGAIQALLKSEMPAGELRRALGELVR